MKTHSRRLISIVSAAALLLAAAAPAQTPSPDIGPTMKAMVYHEFGSPDVLRLEEVAKPAPTDTQLLIKVRGASVNPLDWHYLEGTPYLARLLAFGLLKPKVGRLGVDFAGTVEAVGKSVTGFKPGDDVYGNRFGAFAEYVCASEKSVALKPANLTFEEAAALPVAGLTALQALREHGNIQSGQKVLINGASGGVGTFAIQLAKVFGAEVTAVCSGKNADMVRSLGADHVIDYTKDDFTKGDERYDLILDNVVNRSLSECRGVLKPEGTYVMIGGGSVHDDQWLGPIIRPIKALLLSRFITQKMTVMLADINNKDLTFLSGLVGAGKVKPVIDRTYSLSQLPEALRYLEEGHARGKVVISVGNDAVVSPIPTRPSASSAANPILVALALTVLPLALLIGPVVAALILNRKFQRQHPAKRGYRWGYYFSIMSIIDGIGLGFFLESGFLGVVLCGIVYAALAWFFGQRQRWAWIALTILSLNPVLWLINLFYLWRRWTEVPTAGR
ncbi:MAG: NAD(P)-dependent alcohol dehydrogenase [Chthoniobacterales bacterium]